MSELIEIPRVQWPVLRDMYVDYKPFSSSYFLLQCMINWVKRNPNLDIKIYSLNGEWQNDGTFILEFFEQTFCNTLNNDLSRLTEALSCLNLTTMRIMDGIQERIFPAIMQNFKQNYLVNGQYKTAADGVWYHVQKEQALLFTLDLPAHLKFTTLTDVNVEQVNRLWPHRYAGSEKFVKILIEYNENVGIFENDKLIAWCLRLPLNCLALLQVEESYKRQGLGSLLVRYMAKLLASKNIEVCAPVSITNVASRGMFEKLGFHIIDKIYYRYYKAEINLTGTARG